MGPQSILVSQNGGHPSGHLRVPFQLAAIYAAGMGSGGDEETPPNLIGDDQPMAPENAIRVLIVEDEALVALDMAMILNSAGYQVMGTKPTGDSAMIALNAAAADGILPDLVLMDIALRGPLDGIETTKRIKSNYAGVPVAFVTGQADPITRARAEATNPAGYLLKPFTPDQLINFIKNVLNK